MSGGAYLLSPRFVAWTLTKDRTGRLWVKWLGHERATVAMRYVFSVLLVALGACALYVAFAPD